MSLVATIQTLKAASDPTRLRLLALLANGEATVGELQEILDQSQPRVSRHLRLLSEAGLVEKFRDGQWVYYRLAEAPTAILDEILGLVGHDDPAIRNDRLTLDRVKREREREVFGARIVQQASLAVRPDDAALHEALDDCLRNRNARFTSVLDIGCGSGTLLRLLGQRAGRVVGIDISRRMRLLARSRLHQAGLANCTVRAGDMTKLPFADGEFDLVILDEVLSGGPDALAGLREAARVLARSGQLLILDRIQPVARRLPQHEDNSPLIENQLKAMLAELGLRLEHRHWFPGKSMEYAVLAAVPEQQQRTGTDG